jgi:hypothetical protein
MNKSSPGTVTAGDVLAIDERRVAPFSSCRRYSDDLTSATWISALAASATPLPAWVQHFSSQECNHRAKGWIGLAGEFEQARVRAVGCAVSGLLPMR